MRLPADHRRCRLNVAPSSLRALGRVLCVALVLGGGAANADEGHERDAARVAFGEGSRLFEAQDYPAALAAFRRAQQLQPHDKVRIPIATCLERLARFREAIQQWEVVRHSDEVEEHQRDEAREALDRLGPRLGWLVVDGTPATAQVFVDDELRCPGLPCRAGVDPRVHVVVVRNGAEEQRHRLGFERGTEQRIEVRFGASSPRLSTGEGPLAPTSEPESSYTVGPLFWVGAGLTALGTGGVIGFGLRARAKHDAYVESPSDELRDAGLIARGLTNGSIAVGAVGLVAIVIDLALLAPGAGKSEVKAPVGLTPSGLRWCF